MSPKLGVMAPELTWEKVHELEAAGVDSLWAAGHVTAPAPMREAMVALARLATLAQRATVGTSVVALPLYPPGLVAKQVADIDRWTEGRLVLGIGVGGEYPEEFQACGVPLNERGPRTNEAIPILRRLWAGENLTHEGRFYDMKGVHIDPLPSRPGGPPIVVAGRRDAAIKRAALLGDGWMPYLYSASKYERSVDAIRELATAAGRDLSTFLWTSCVFVAVGDTREQARRDAAEGMAASLRAEGNPDFGEILDRVAVAGNEDDVVAGLQAFVDAGAEHLILTPIGAGDRQDQCLRLIQAIAPRLQDKKP